MNPEIWGVIKDRLLIANGKNLNGFVLIDRLEEIWKDVKDFEGYYQVSNLGRVRSLDRYITRSDGVVQFKKGAIKAPKNSTDNYDLITLSKNGHSKTMGLHILVATEFVDNPMGLPEVNHKDFNRKNNQADNLEWVTHLDNIKYSAENGRYKLRNINGENNPNYGNHALKEYYAANPDIAKAKLSRPGASNGKAKSIIMYSSDNTEEQRFSYIGECAEYLMASGISKATRKQSLADRISIASKSGSLFLGHYFKIINKKETA